MPNIQSVFLTVQKLWPRWKFLPQTDRTKTRCPQIPFQGHKNSQRKQIYRQINNVLWLSETFSIFCWSVIGWYHQQAYYDIIGNGAYIKRKRNRSDLVQWQKPFHTDKSNKHKNATEYFNYTTIVDWLRTVSWCNDSHSTGVVKLV